jgi:hypothetical protein
MNHFLSNGPIPPYLLIYLRRLFFTFDLFPLNAIYLRDWSGNRRQAAGDVGGMTFLLV